MTARGSRPDRPTLLGRVAVAVGVLCCLWASVSGAHASPVIRPATVWLCRPGVSPDPCSAPLSTTLIAADGRRQLIEPRPAAHPKIDCFYVYPTVSAEPTANADLRIQAAEKAVAFAQASQFSQVCRVWAPMYRQLTLGAISGRIPVTLADVELAYVSVRSAFEEYLAHDNDGRGIVFLGHSQGAMVLIKLLQQVVDPSPKLRRLLVSAIVLGGNVTVPERRLVGGSFRRIPACRTPAEVGCVIAYSSFRHPQPANALFGRVGIGINAVPGQSARSGLEVLCVDPAAMAGGWASLDPEFPQGSGPAFGEVGPEPRASSAWVSFPGRYRARCERKGGASWLEVVPKPNDPRPVLTQVLGPQWGLHLADVNVALGNLVDVVVAEARAWPPRTG